MSRPTGAPPSVEAYTAINPPRLSGRAPGMAGIFLPVAWGPAVDRLCVFIDYQNVYMRAREVFGDASTRHDFTFGQIFPQRLGVLLRQRSEDAGYFRELTEVRVYRGEPDAARSPTGQAACQRQVRFWNAQASVQAFTRPLNYRVLEWRDGHPTRWDIREKGIDVMIAVDMVRGAMNDEYDVAILLSADTDLLPAADAVVRAEPPRDSWRLFPLRGLSNAKDNQVLARGSPSCGSDVCRSSD